MISNWQFSCQVKCKEFLCASTETTIWTLTLRKTLEIVFILGHRMGLTKERKMKYETQKKGYYVQLQKGKKSDTVSLFFATTLSFFSFIRREG